MQKEVFIAIAFGSLLGLAVAFGVWRTNISLNSNKITSEKKEGEIKKVEPIDNLTQELSIVSPQPYTVVVNADTSITGLATNSKYAIIMTKNTENISLVNNEEFTFNIKLEGGLNSINIFAINDASDTISRSLPLVYSAKLKPQKEDSTDIHTRVQERLDQQKNPTLALVGTVTDITEDYFQIKSQTGEIKQLSINGQTTYGSDVQDNKEIEFKDVAIGDFIVAIGKFDDNEVLDTERVLVSSAPGENNFLVIKDIVSEINRKEVILEGGSVFRLGTHTVYQDVAKEKKIPRENLDQGCEVIIAGERNGDTLSARSVFVLSF